MEFNIFQRHRPKNGLVKEDIITQLSNTHITDAQIQQLRFKIKEND